MNALMKMKNYTVNTMENKNIKIGLVIMASGLGKRFGSNKLMEILVNKPLIKWIIDITDGIFDRRIVVTRSKDVKDLCDSLNINCIYHELPGRNDTIRLGLEAIMNEIDYCFFSPGDQPLIKKETFHKLTSVAKADTGKIIRTCHNDIVGTPTGFPKILFDDLLKLPDKKGGNWLVNKNLSLVKKVMTQEEYELWDIDTASDLEKIKIIIDKNHI